MLATPQQSKRCLLLESHRCRAAWLTAMVLRCTLVLLTVYSLCASVNGSDRSLLVSIHPNNPPATRSFDPNLLIGSDDLDVENPRIKKRAFGCQEPEQVHLTLWSSTAVLVSWATCDAQLGQATPVATEGIKSIVLFGGIPKLGSQADGVATSYAYDYSEQDYGSSYASPVLHHVLLAGLTPGQTYYYKVASSNAAPGADLSEAASSGRLYNFTMPALSSFPLRLGVMGDPGQTSNTSETLDRFIATKPDLALILGDFCYADNWLTATELVRNGQYGTVTYQPKWDTWGRLFEPLLSHVPLMHTNGNHEIEQLANGNRNSAYNHRFPTPYMTGHDTTRGPTRFTPVSPSELFANLYYSVELPGVLKFISITSYAPGQTFSHQEQQYRWLEEELAKTDRAQTPWLIVATHAPWYNTYQGHFKENECMRQAYEPLLLKHQVDLVLAGHVHAYERTKPLAFYRLANCGPMYVTIGDAGNVEGLYNEFIDDSLNGQPAYCQDPTNNPSALFPPKYQPQACYSWQDGQFCPQQQPEWSAYREPSFGFGMLEFMSATKATWTWYKNQWPAWKAGDQVTITRRQGCLQSRTTH